jgi:sulfopropanediol 3-dehydrogenase
MVAMPITYLKRAQPAVATHDTATTETVRTMLDAIAAGGEPVAQAYAAELDGWHGPVVVAPEAFARAEAALSEGVKQDIRFARDRVQDFARRQRDSMQEFSAELIPGLTVGQRLIPCQTAGCYVPGGRYAHAASAIMSVGTAAVAGVRHIVAATPAHAQDGIHPAILYAMQLCGVSTVLALGGVQGVAALAHGLFTGRPADIIVGPGNRFVAEAKRQVFGQVGIDMIAGPSEILVIADDSANPKWIAADLLSQAEHDENARSVLVTDNEALAKAVEQEIEAILKTLSRKAIALVSWRNNGLVILAKNMDEAAEIANLIAPEHVELMTKNPEALAQKIIHAGAIFMGHYTPEAIGDYVAGPSHVLPTSSTARFSSGLSVYDFLKRSSIINCTEKSFRAIAPAASTLAAEEGLTAHKLSVDLR